MQRVLNRDRDKAMLDAIDKIGGSGKLARRLGITAQSISGWERVPVMRVLEVERATGIPRHILRPDAYPQPEPSP